MLFRRLLLSTLFVLVAAGVGAQTVPDPARATEEARQRMTPLLDAMRIPALLEIIQREGLKHAEDLEADMFPGRGGTQWPQMVAQIYGPARAQGIMLDELAADLEPWHIDPLMDFFESELGARIVSLEISAREAMIDPSVETASNEFLDGMRAGGAGRLDLLEAFVTINDLIDMNVTGALNANYAFYSGLNNAGAFDRFLGEEDMLREVWSQEADIRDETDLWVHSYLALAYQPLTDAELEKYIAMSETESGKALNTYLFAAFDEVFQTLSYDLGMAAARFMSGEDL